MATRKPRLPPLDPEEGRKLILQAVQSAEAPLTLASLGAIPELGRKVPQKQVRDWIDPEVASGHVFKWGTAYWNRDPEALTRERILELTARELLTGKQIKERLKSGTPSLNQTLVTSALKDLKRRQLREVAKRLVNKDHPEVYLEEAVAGLLQSFGLRRSPDRIRALLADGEHQPAEEHTVTEVAEKIFSTMNRLAFSPGATVTFYRLRQDPELSEVPKRIFDRAALLLQSERRALLSIHGHAMALPDSEREELVTDGHGNFYVSIYSW